MATWGLKSLFSFALEPKLNPFSSKVLFRCIAKDVTVPKPGAGACYRRVVHFPKKYTVEPIPYTRLGGRDPITKRLVAKGIGGGIKFPYHWVDWHRLPPNATEPLVEKVLHIIKDGCRTANIALVASGDRMRYIMATENMKPGDIIKSSNEIPRIPVRVYEGDAHPLGAYPIGTQVCDVEMIPGKGGFLAHGAGTCCTVVRRIGDRVIVQLPSKQELSLQQECMAVAGRMSNVMHNKTPIGSAQKNRELGNRPRSGLWQRKTGRFGRKIRPLPPVRVISSEKPEDPLKISLDVNWT
ncbi:39S ribosomal protein L2, mitochondrial [Ischnura elegans]|uniref:39S ribosomal protein L2, mitochondrial n=1 Tax=Ischnura elegans TaxID=197161 RepID=UPI001ED88304|nr:39S ribosomal protein L2, mitochondrial [Ischnura elegans]